MSATLHARLWLSMEGILHPVLGGGMSQQEEAGRLGWLEAFLRVARNTTNAFLANEIHETPLRACEM